MGRDKYVNTISRLRRRRCWILVLFIFSNNSMMSLSSDIPHRVNIVQTIARMMDQLKDEMLIELITLREGRYKTYK
jgi:hypothetical protein